MAKKDSKKRIGIFAGTFDPVHTGHVTFALQAIENAKLDSVVFVPERKPRGKTGVEHFGHRVAMIRQAIKPHSKLGILELVEARFDTKRTLPHLKAAFPDAQLALLIGSDILLGMRSWPMLEQLCNEVELVVGVRQGESSHAMELQVATWPHQPKKLYAFNSYAPAVSSSKVRTSLRDGQTTHGVLASVRKYSGKNWLYVRLSKKPTKPSSI